MRKVRKVVVVDSAAFPFWYSQGGAHTIRISFRQSNAIFEAFGGLVSLPANDAANPVIYFEVETRQQNAYYDDICLETGTPLTQVYYDEFGTDTNGTYLVF